MKLRFHSRLFCHALATVCILLLTRLVASAADFGASGQTHFPVAFLLGSASSVSVGEGRSLSDSDSAVMKLTDFTSPGNSMLSFPGKTSNAFIDFEAHRTFSLKDLSPFWSGIFARRIQHWGCWSVKYPPVCSP